MSNTVVSDLIVVDVGVDDDDVVDGIIVLGKH